MATDLRNLPAFFNVDADFQAWVAGIHAQLAAVGLVNTGDSGQINPATVLKPAGTSTVQGYEIWRLNDSLQATAPVYLKVEYGSGSGAADRPSLWLTPGTATNGAGTLTGQVGARRQQFQSAAKSAGVVLPSYFTGDGSGVAFVTSYDASSNTFVIWGLIERTRDGAGTATADGIITFSGSSGLVQCAFQTIPFVGPVAGGVAQSATTALVLSPGIAVANAVVPGAIGANVPIAPLYSICGRFVFAKLAHLGLPATVSNGVPFTATAFGGTHTLMPLPTISPSAMPSGSSAVDCLLLMWE